MACRRAVSTTATLAKRRFHPSLSHVLHDNNEDTKSHSLSSSTQPNMTSTFPSGSYNSTIGFSFGSQSRGRAGSSLAWKMGIGSFHFRHMSTSIGDGLNKVDDIGFVGDVITNKIGDGSDKMDAIGYVAEVITNKTAEVVTSQGAAASEVAVAAADSFLPVFALQHLIDFVHSLTGLNWWASIALTTVLIRTATLPLLIGQLRATSKLTLMRPRLEQLKQEMQNMATDPEFLREGQKRMMALFKEYGVTPFSQLQGIIIQGPIFISFFLAIRNMAMKVPSFQNGGALWFTDLTTPDSLVILPILTAMTFWITVEWNMQEGLAGNPVAKTMKTYSRILAVIAIPVMMGIPKALFCYWLTSNIFSLTYGLAIKTPKVKQLLNLPEIPKPPPAASQPPFPLFEAVKKDITIESEPSLPTETSKKDSDRSISSSSILKQRLKSLEKHVNGKKKRN
ncbi:mitochondrial inner membrane protein OXA1-like [Argentina anserina]|uniref:mitochondrial inner membrane protein OXA1-like n=1 Tax=Argentina anserina TaxID=57926 RepID=UPI0021768041|nr:mitochondrial inner membrane protein OXA1-like [Potentilla anserina]XP_050385966.1 mitochondrial inner membrane protein OXA1-like [Potentilla anserina]